MVNERQQISKTDTVLVVSPVVFDMVVLGLIGILAIAVPLIARSMPQT